MSCFESAWDIVHADLPRPQKLMLNIYWLHCNRTTGTAYISLARLQGLMCSTRTTTVKARQALVKKGLLVKRGEKYQCTVYALGTEALKDIAIPDPRWGTGTVRPNAMKGTAFDVASTSNEPNVVHLLQKNRLMLVQVGSLQSRVGQSSVVSVRSTTRSRYQTSHGIDGRRNGFELSKKWVTWTTS